MSFESYLRQRPMALRILIGLTLIALSGFIDNLTGYDVVLLLFYLIPIYYFIWFLSRRLGIAVSVICALIWTGENIIDNAHAHHFQTFYLNMSIELMFFFLTTFLLCVLKESLDINAKLSRLDIVTGAMSRDAFYDAAVHEVDRLGRYKHPFTVAYMDIDNFKIINYRFGHQTGDRLLNTVANTIRKNLRKVDFVARFGGDEFTVLLPETGAEAAQVILSRIRNVLLNMMDNNKWPVTFTFGTITFLKAPSSVEEMMKKVGSVMYAAKDSGMNTIEQEIINA